MHSLTSHHDPLGEFPHGISKLTTTYKNFQFHIPFTWTELLDHLPASSRCCYENDFHLADAAFYAGHVVATTKNRHSNWTDWERYVAPLGLDPYLQDTPFPWRVRALTRFAVRAWKGAFGKGRQVQARTVSGYVLSVGQTIALAIRANPVKTKNGDKYLMRLQQTLDGWRHADPPTQKKLPVESDVPEYLVN